MQKNNEYYNIILLLWYNPSFIDERSQVCTNNYRHLYMLYKNGVQTVYHYNIKCE